MKEKYYFIMCLMPHIFITDSDFSNIDKTFEYLLGFQPSLGAIILGDNFISIILDSRYFLKLENIDEEKLSQILKINNLEVKKINCSDFLESIIGELKNKKNATLENNIAIKYYNHIQKKLPNLKIKISENYFGKKRILKNKDEIKNIKKAIKIIDGVFLHIKKLANSHKLNGKTEKEIRSIIISKILDLGGKSESFDSIVAFGKNSAIPHHETSDTIISNGPLLIDMGAIYNAYCSDFTRTFWVGERDRSYKKFKEIYDIVKNSHLESIKKFKSGMTGKDLDKISRDYIKKSGYGKYYTHSLGHGVGLDIHEEPKISKSGVKKLKNKMVFTIEPGIYLPGKFGVRLEDIVFLSNNKLEKYSKMPL